MNPELEAIFEALYAWKSASQENAEKSEEHFNALIEDLCQRHPAQSRHLLRLSIFRKYPQWLRAQQKPPSMPPKA
jgi:hypothetical protein